MISRIYFYFRQLIGLREMFNNRLTMLYFHFRQILAFGKCLMIFHFRQALVVGKDALEIISTLGKCCRREMFFEGTSTLGRISYREVLDDRLTMFFEMNFLL